MVTPDGKVTPPVVEYSPWHTVTITRTEVPYAIRGAVEVQTETDFEVDHPAECDALRYGEPCWFDQIFSEYGSTPSEPGTYRARVWSEGPDDGGCFEGGNEWHPETGGAP